MTKIPDIVNWVSKVISPYFPWFIQSFPLSNGGVQWRYPQIHFLNRIFHEINHPSYWGTLIGNPDSSFPGDAGVAHQESWIVMGFEVRTKHFMVMGWDIPSGYLTVCHGKSPFLRTVNHLFLWATYTMAMLVITRG